LLNHQVKFKNWYMLVLSQYHKFESYKINIYSVCESMYSDSVTLWAFSDSAKFEININLRETACE
jgi:hypothetical protein